MTPSILDEAVRDICKNFSNAGSLKELDEILTAFTMKVVEESVPEKRSEQPLLNFMGIDLHQSERSIGFNDCRSQTLENARKLLKTE